MIANFEPSTVQSPAGDRRDTWTALSATLVVQSVLQAYFFPLGELFTATPQYYIDSAYHQYQMETARLLCALHQLVGYDPFFAAGYLGGVNFNASAKLPALLACAAGGAQAVVPIYKIYSFTMGALAPVGLVTAAVLLRFDRRATWVVAVFALLIWWTGPIRWYHTAGLVSYVTVAYWSIPFAVGVSKTCQAPSAGRVLAIALGAAVGALIHPLFIVAAILLCGPLLLVDVRAHDGLQRIASVALPVALSVLLVNGVWLRSSLSGPNLASEQPYQRLVDPLLVLREPLGIAATASGGSRLYLALIVGTIAALFLSAERTRRVLFALTSAAALLMLWASMGGVHKSLAALQPNRFSALAWLVVSLPAAWGASALLVFLRRRHGAYRVLPGLGLLLMGAISLFFVREMAFEILSQRSARYAVVRPEVKGEGKLSHALENWIRTQTDPSARIYFETSMARVHDGAHMAGIYALNTQREFIGGPYPYTDFASAWDGVAFGRSLEAFAPGELARYLDLYNIKWMLCHSAPCRSAMDAVPDATRLAYIGPITAFARSMTPTYFLTGTGIVRARCINRVEVEVQDGAAIVLKYHWVPGLTTVPPMPVEQRYMYDDPRPFIAIAHPVPRFSLGVGELAASCHDASGPLPK